MTLSAEHLYVGDASDTGTTIDYFTIARDGLLQQRSTHAGVEAGVRRLALLPGGSGLLSAHEYATNDAASTRVTRIDPETGELLGDTAIGNAAFDSHGVTGLVVDPSGRLVYASHSSEGQLNIFRRYTYDDVSNTLSHRGGANSSERSFRTLAMDPGGRFLFRTSAGNAPGEFEWLDVLSINPVDGAVSTEQTLTNAGLLSAIAVSPDGALVATVSANGAEDQLSVFRISTKVGELELAGVQPLLYPGVDVAFHPDGGLS